MRLLRLLPSVFGTTLRSKSITNSKCLSISTCLKESTQQNADEPISMKNPFEHEKGKCILCKMNIRPDYKNIKLLSQFVSPYTGRVYGRHITGLCKKRQGQVESELLKARMSGLMPFYFKDPVFLKDPKLFNPERPFRPHDY